MVQKRVTFSIPKQFYDDVSYVSRRMGISRSALLTNLSSEPIADMRTMLEVLPENPTPADLVRARGASVAIVKERMANLRKLEESDDLFSD